MIIRKITGKTLHEARTEATRLYNSSYVIIESRAGTTQTPAYITISLDPSVAVRADQRKAEEKESVLKPFVKVMNRWLDAGGTALTSLKKNAPDPDSDSGAESMKRTQERGVSFERSGKPAEEKKPVGDPEQPGKENEDFFRHHFKRKKERNTHDQQSYRSMRRRLEVLEQMVWKVTEEQHTHYSSHPMYRFLRKLQFRPELLMDWFDKHEDKIEQNEDSEASMQFVIQGEVQQYFQPDGLPGESCHLFTSFSGTNTSELISALHAMYRQKGIKPQTGLIFSNLYDADETGLQMIDSLKNRDILCQSLVTHHDWETFSKQAAEENAPVLLMTIPIPYSIGAVEQHWSYYNRVLGEYHSVKHHFVTHALAAPEEIADQLPAEHPFSPDYVTITNVEMCKNSIGKLSVYKDLLDCSFGFFHKNGTPTGSIELNISNEIFRVLKSELDTAKTLAV